jgi:hypothetical protein
MVTQMLIQALETTFDSDTGTYIASDRFAAMFLDDPDEPDAVGGIPPRHLRRLKRETASVHRTRLALLYAVCEADGPDAEHRMIADAVRLKRAASKPGAWRRVVRGEVPVSDIVSIVARRAGGSLSKARRMLARSIGRPIGDDLEAELSSAARPSRV